MLNKLPYIIIICLVCIGAKQATTYDTINVISIVSVYDGDTFRANLHNMSPLIGNNMPIRINGIDTPEMRGGTLKTKAKAKLARNYASKLLLAGDKIELRNPKRGKYFRIVADVYIDDVNLGDSLIRAGLAVPYEY